MKSLPPLMLLGALFVGCGPEPQPQSTPKPKPTKSPRTTNAQATATAFAWDHPITSPPVESPTKARPTSTPYPVAKRFNEYERRDIFRLIVEAEDRSQAEADAEYPTDFDSIGRLDDATQRKILEKNGDLSNKLAEKYRNRVYKQFRLSKKEQDLIGIEGQEKHWPPL